MAQAVRSPGGMVGAVVISPSFASVSPAQGGALFEPAVPNILHVARNPWRMWALQVRPCQLFKRSSGTPSRRAVVRTKQCDCQICPSSEGRVLGKWQMSEHTSHHCSHLFLGRHQIALRHGPSSFGLCRLQQGRQLAGRPCEQLLQGVEDLLGCWPQSGISLEARLDQVRNLYRNGRSSMSSLYKYSSNRLC